MHSVVGLSEVWWLGGSNKVLMWWGGGGGKTKDNDVATKPTCLVSSSECAGSEGI